MQEAQERGLIPGLGRPPGEGTGNPLQDSYLGKPMDRGSLGLQAVGPQSQTQLNTASSTPTTAANPNQQRHWKSLFVFSIEHDTV